MSEDAGSLSAAIRKVTASRAPLPEHNPSPLYVPICKACGDSIHLNDADEWEHEEPVRVEDVRIPFGPVPPICGA